MFENRFQESALILSNEKETEQLKSFLSRYGLSMDKDIEYSMVVTDNNRIVATGSFANRVLKCIAVEDEYKGRGLSAKIITHLVNEQFARGKAHLFIYTKPENELIFSGLGFFSIAQVPHKVVLMENRPDGIKRYLDEIAAETGTILPSAAVVVNCNPFTNGHRYLLEYAAARCRLLHVFVVWEDRSFFPSQIRHRLVCEGTAHIPNLIVHKGSDYIISNATFPSYFIKEYDDLVETHARLDLEVFSQHIAKKLDIRKRFAGEEPYCRVTSAYNRMMAKILPQNGIEVEIIPRKTSDGNVISASRVRELLGKGYMDAVKKLVPETTYRFLMSDEGRRIIHVSLSKL